MKARIESALTLMQGILAANQIPLGGQAEVQFKQAMTELEGALAEPEPTAPEPHFTQEQLSEIGTSVQDVLTGLTTRLTNLEQATICLIDPLQAVNDKLDGMEDTLAAFVAQQPATAG